VRQVLYEEAMLNDWRYQIRKPRQFSEKALAKPSHRGAGQGSNAAYCFDGGGEQ
jgi:hypothetical protein